MKTIRIGNDTNVTWKILSRNGMPYSLEEKILGLWLVSGPYRKEISTYQVSSINKIEFSIDADELKRYGIYKLIFRVKDSEAVADDAAYELVQVFQIVSASYPWISDVAIDGSVDIEFVSILNNVIVSTLRGESAYEVAVRHGYTGTEEEWLAGLKGDQGVSIESVEQTVISEESGGVNKATVTLTNGDQSELEFRNGEKGDRGIQGETGPQGIQGAAGLTGPKGNKGDKGDSGVSLGEVALTTNINETETGKALDASAMQTFLHFLPGEESEEIEEVPSNYYNRQQVDVLLNDKQTQINNQNQKIEDFKAVVKDMVDNYPNVTYEGDVTNMPDGEDLTTDSSNHLKLANRPALDGMGYVILRKNKTFAEQVTQANTIYEIKYEFNLGGESVTIPEGCVLKFVGGQLSNGTIVGNNTGITPIGRCFSDIAFDGDFILAKVFAENFGGYSSDTLLLDALFGLFAKSNASLLVLENKTYQFKKTDFPVSESVYYEFNNVSNKCIDGNGAVIFDTTNYGRGTSQDWYYVFFLNFVNCSFISIRNLKYDAPYGDISAYAATRQGVEFAVFNGDCSNCDIDISVNNARSGVSLQQYEDVDHPIVIGPRNFEINIQSDCTSYPIAVNWVTDAKFTISCSNQHRALYLLGAENVIFSIICKTANVSTETAVLIADSKEYDGNGGELFRHCKNICGEIALSTDKPINDVTYATRVRPIGIEFATREIRDTSLSLENISLSVVVNDVTNCATYQINSNEWDIKPGDSIKNISLRTSGTSAGADSGIERILFKNANLEIENINICFEGQFIPTSLYAGSLARGLTIIAGTIPRLYIAPGFVVVDANISWLGTYTYSDGGVYPTTRELHINTKNNISIEDNIDSSFSIFDINTRRWVAPISRLDSMINEDSYLVLRGGIIGGIMFIVRNGTTNIIQLLLSGFDCTKSSQSDYGFDISASYSQLRLSLVFRYYSIGSGTWSEWLQVNDYQQIRYISTAQRLASSLFINGMSVYDSDLKRLVSKGSGRWVEGDGATAGVLRSGLSSNRPATSDIYVGFVYFDETLNKPIWHKGGGVWVDATGATV